MDTFNTLFPMPTGGRNADDMGMPPPAEVASNEEGGTCNVCGGLLRYGGRHRKCGDAVMAAIATERERCAKLCEDACAYTGGHGEPSAPSGYELARRIRKA